MKFKFASLLELIIPLSVALLLSAFLGCGGSAYGTSKTAYDGTWYASLVILKPDKGGASEVACAGPSLYPFTMANGFGHATVGTECVYGYLNGAGSAVYATDLDVKVTYGNLAAASAVVYVDVVGGNQLIGTCDTPNSCVATGFYMYRP